MIAMIVLSLVFAIATSEFGKVEGSMQREWYLVASKGFDKFLNIEYSLE
mgnify:CR=1 FL=1